MRVGLANIDGRAVLVRGDQYVDLPASDPMALLQRDLQGLWSNPSLPTGPLPEALLGPPVPRPSKVFAIGLNYRAHAAEAEMEIPRHPVVFTKFPSCIVGPQASVELRSDRCDYEGELVVVVGPGGRDIAVEHAWDHVAGLMVGQDISDRKIQFLAKPTHFSLGKSFDTFGPTGPLLVPPHALPHRDDLRITTTVNGEVRQDDRTSNMIFDVPTLLSRLSRVTTLMPGDLIFTGTPEGVGALKRSYLQDGDEIVTTIEGIGTLRNRCVRVSDHGLL